MQVIFSPAKKQEYGAWQEDYVNEPMFKDQVAMLIEYLATLSSNDISSMMSVSSDLAELNYNRFQKFEPNNWDVSNTGPALLSFKGDAYKSLDADRLSKTDLLWADKHVFILSGLYGLLRPLDPIQYYRLEMKTKLKNYQYKNLYDFWGDTLKNKLANDVIINLASSEYFKATRLKNAITIDFKEPYNSGFKTIGLKAKRARGLMLRYIIQNRIQDPQKLQEFRGGYRFNHEMSNNQNWVFIAEQ